MGTPHRAPALVAVAVRSVALLVGCAREAAPAVTDGPSSSSPAPAAPAPSTADVPAVAGYRVGEVPPVPLFVLPDVTPLTAAQRAVSDDLTAALGAVPGLEVPPARCAADGDAGSGVLAGGGIVLDGEGGGVATGPDGTTTNGGDGSGVTVSGTATIVVNGDGSGSYSDAGLIITVGGDGSGSYTDGLLTVVNDGEGTALVGGTEVPADPLPPVAPVGSMPPVQALAPIGPVCGTLVRLPGDVLFDFDADVVRPDAAAVLDAVASVLTATAPTGPVLVDGHTDGFGEDAHNQDLSERRAAAVVAALQGDGVTTPLEARGSGESAPVAVETVDGRDDPAARQLDRRVELVLP